MTGVRAADPASCNMQKLHFLHHKRDLDRGKIGQLLTLLADGYQHKMNSVVAKILFLFTRPRIAIDSLFPSPFL